ncbi:MAG TPA: hypothetical protein VFQ61_30385 [Polyangiaceae bacterium]|nr:hypothetical protein [Polyangiaceae bacterium]
MNALQALSEPAPGGVCRVCEQQLPAGSLACSQCGAVYGEANRCPHCRAIAGIEPDRPAGRCKVCGGPRIALKDPRTLRSGRETHLLRQAEVLQRKRRLSLLFTSLLAASGAFALLATLFVIFIADPGALLATIGFALAAVVGGLAWPLARDARSARRERARLLEQARLIVASDVIASHAQPVTPLDLASYLETTQEDAELLLAELDLGNMFRARVSVAGEIHHAELSATPAATWLAEDVPVAAPDAQFSDAGPPTATAEAMAFNPALPRPKGDG